MSAKQRKIFALFWPEVPKYEMALGLILVLGTGWGPRMVPQVTPWAGVQPGL